MYGYSTMDIVSTKIKEQFSDFAYELYADVDYVKCKKHLS